MELKTVEQHNKEIQEREKLKRRLDQTGIACPKCGHELSWSSGGVMLSSPPQRNVHCHKCKHNQNIFV